MTALAIRSQPRSVGAKPSLMAKVLVTDKIAEDGLEILRTEAEVDVHLGISPEDLIKMIPEYQALVVRSETKVTADVLAAGSQLLVVGRAGVGVDNIDLKAATQCGAIVVNAPEGNTIAAAEHTIALMLALARHVPGGHASLSSGTWDRSKFLGVELRGKTMGIIGLGRVGMEVARRARGLEMNVVAHDPFVSTERAQALNIRLVTKENVVAESDFLTIHVPLSATNPTLVGESELNLAKPVLRVINVSRGGQVDEAALIAALDTGKVAGAAIDVFEQEPPSMDLPILTHPKVIVTPHLGASTAEAQERVAVDVAHQVLAVLRGEPALYAVNLPFMAADTFKLISPYLKAATQAAALATQISSGQFEGIEIEYLGELASLEVAPITAAIVQALLAPVGEENVTLVNASLIAERRGIRIAERKGHSEGIYKDLIRVHVGTSDAKTTVSATPAEDGPHIVEINDFWLDISPGAGNLLLCENVDRPGMIGRIGSFLGEKDINISSMRVGRESVRGRALMVIGLDDDLDADTLAELCLIPNIFTARTARI